MFSFHGDNSPTGGTDLRGQARTCSGSSDYPPNATKGLRQFSLAEVAYFLGVTTQSNVKKLHLEGKGPAPSDLGSRADGPILPRSRCWSFCQYLDRHGRADFKKYVPHRRAVENRCK